MTKLASSILLLFLLSVLTVDASAQCNPTLKTTGKICAEQLLKFESNAPGFTFYSWDFGDGTESFDRDPFKAFSKPGTYIIQLSAKGPSGTCDKSISLTVFPIPEINLALKGENKQCFRGNEFCFIDSTIPVSKVYKQVYRFSDGHEVVVQNPSFPRTECHAFKDAKGGSYKLTVESYDSSGCVARKVYHDDLIVHPTIGLKIKSNSPVGCDSTMARITNESLIELKDIATFCWDFGNGDTVCGDSITNNEFWFGKRKDGRIEKWYRTYGTFNLTLSVKTKYGCEDKYSYKAAATNIGFEPTISGHLDSVQVGEEINFKMALGPVPGAYFRWEFGEPSSGIMNYNDKTQTPSYRYSSLGPKMISFTIVSGPCYKRAFDTLQVLGPLARIEAANVRVSSKERYQCVMTDTIHFTNNSLFYQNDSDPEDEDSVVYVNGKKRFVFDYDFTTWHGDQTAVTNTRHFANRTMGSLVKRLWDFGDVYAEQCTTSTEQNLNIGKNCNFSTDEFPVHKYQDWDSVYLKQYYNNNDTFEYTSYYIGTSKTIAVDTSDKLLHYDIFNKTIAHNYTARLWLKDTVSGNESTDEIVIYATKPDASKMTVDVNTSCLNEVGNDTTYITYNLNTGSQSYVAINFDSAENPDGFVQLTSAKLTDQFVKGYSQDDLKKLQQSKNVMGVIVGNGPVGSSGEPPACLDTVWYTNPIQSNLLQPQFKILGSKSGSSFCKGDTVYFQLENPNQSEIAQLSWNWGDANNEESYSEQNYLLQKYDGPKANRNDKDVKYNGEDWLYNYVVRQKTNVDEGTIVLDTIVTAIVKEYRLDYTGPKIHAASTPGHFVEEIPNHEVYQYIGKSIDTTGLSQYFVPREYRDNRNGLLTYHNGKRYRYLDDSKKDSIEVAQILHYRDTSLRGFDTYIKGTDTIKGVWKHVYRHREIIFNNGDFDTTIKNSVGGMNPRLTLNNLNGCSSQRTNPITVGFLLKFMPLTDLVCENDVVQLYDSIRYFQLGANSFPNDYPIDPRKLWEDPFRYARSFEVKSIDWDSTDGIGNAKSRALNFFHIYKTAGVYTLTMFARDSLGCLDTAQSNVEVVGVNVDFSIDILDTCDRVYQFTDTSTFSSGSEFNDSVIEREWIVENDTLLNKTANPVHIFKKPEDYRITLKSTSALGCNVKKTKNIEVKGAKPFFNFDGSAPSLIPDTVTIYQKDTILVFNYSFVPMNSPTFILFWGDGSFTDLGHTANKHSYNQPGTYYPYMLMNDRLEGTSTRCDAYYPYTPITGQVPQTTRVVIVLADSLNAVTEHLLDANVYPNPNTGAFKVLIGMDNSILDARLTNIYGQELSTKIEYLNVNTIQLQTSGAITGNYILTIHTQKGTIRKKVTIVD